MKLTDKLLIAAEKVFITRGLEQSTIEEICLLAEVSRPSFYKRFKDKDELFADYVLIKSKLLVEQLEIFASEIKDKKTFLQNSKNYLIYMYTDEVLSFHGMVAGEARLHNKVKYNFRMHLVAKHMQLRQQVIMQLIICGLIKPTNKIDGLAKLLGSLITADSYYLTVTGGQEPLSGKVLDDFVNERCDLFLRIANDYFS